MRKLLLLLAIGVLGTTSCSKDVYHEGDTIIILTSGTTTGTIVPFTETSGNPVDNEDLAPVKFDVVPIGEGSASKGSGKSYAGKSASSARVDSDFAHENDAVDVTLTRLSTGQTFVFTTVLGADTPAFELPKNESYSYEFESDNYNDATTNSLPIKNKVDNTFAVGDEGLNVELGAVTTFAVVTAEEGNADIANIPAPFINLDGTPVQLIARSDLFYIYVNTDVAPAINLNLTWEKNGHSGEAQTTTFIPFAYNHYQFILNVEVTEVTDTQTNNVSTVFTIVLAQAFELQANTWEVTHTVTTTVETDDEGGVFGETETESNAPSYDGNGNEIFEGFQWYTEVTYGTTNYDHYKSTDSGVQNYNMVVATDEDGSRIFVLKLQVYATDGTSSLWSIDVNGNLQNDPDFDINNAHFSSFEQLKETYEAFKDSY